SDERSAVDVTGDEGLTTPTEPSDGPTIGRLSDEVTEDGVFQAVLDGYDALYDALARSATFNRIWRTHAYGGEFPAAFAHIGFLTLDEGHWMLDALHLGEGDTLVDVACGAGGPGLWAAQQSGAAVGGIDPAGAGIAAARQRAGHGGLEERSRSDQGSC